jgi:hypothetical protein
MMTTRLRRTCDELFRFKLEREDMKGKVGLITALEGNAAGRWTGPDRHVVRYPTRHNQVFNIEMAYLDRDNTDEVVESMASQSALLEGV